MAANFPSNKRQKGSVEPESIKWISCRSGMAGEQLSFEDAVLSGWAPDGGMLLPTNIPLLSTTELESWRSLSYPMLCTAVLSKWIPTNEIGQEDLNTLIISAFNRFGLDRIVDVTSLPKNPSEDNNIDYHVLELFHGPTLAFKDLGMCVLCEILQFFLMKRNRRVTLLVGTSGDTGPSAFEAVRGMENVIDCVVLYPRGRVSKVQEGQMLHCGKTMPNATVIGVDGTSDDLDIPCEAVLKDNEFKTTHCLGTVNSVNIIRMLVQTVHYFYGYLQRTPKNATSTNNSKLISFAVPSGAAGHMCAGVLARLMGLPMHRLLVATNANDVLHVMIATGKLGKAPDGAAHTLSNAMDIQVPYNYERLLYLCCQDPVQVKDWVNQVSAGHTVQLPASIWQDQFQVQLGLLSYCIGKNTTTTTNSTPMSHNNDQNCDEEVLKTMKTIYQLNGYIIDPHTAVGVTAAKIIFPSISSSSSSLSSSSTQHEVLCMGCAHPAKFAETVCTALEQSSLSATAQLLGDRDPNHIHVQVALGLLNDTSNHQQAGERNESLVPGETRRFERHGDWTTQLREIIEAISTRRTTN